MRLLILIPAIAMAASATGAAPLHSQSQNRTDCPATSRYHAAQRGEAAKFSRLGHLPAAEAYKAVFRRDARGCDAPIVVRYDIGASDPSKPAR